MSLWESTPGDPTIPSRNQTALTKNSRAVEQRTLRGLFVTDRFNIPDILPFAFRRVSVCFQTGFRVCACKGCVLA